MKSGRSLPQQMDMLLMQQLNNQQPESVRKKLFFSNDIVISEGANFFELLLKACNIGPFEVEDYRFGFIAKGELNITVNLVDHHLTEGSILFISRGAIAQINSVSPDFAMDGMIVNDEMIHNAFENHRPNMISGAVLNFSVKSTKEDREFIKNNVHTMWDLLHRDSYPKKALYALVASMLYYYEGLYQNQQDLHYADLENIRKREVFHRFISLINENVMHERSLAHYAEMMDLTPRYLSSLISSFSGHPAKYWIDRATITRAKLLLRHSTKSVLEISKEMNFPNDSFFCRYFRRVTGKSPKEYRG